MFLKSTDKKLSKHEEQSQNQRYMKFELHLEASGSPLWSETREMYYAVDDLFKEKCCYSFGVVLEGNLKKWALWYVSLWKDPNLIIVPNFHTLKILWR